MKIAILSGKGGTGKTTVSSNFFHLLKQATLIDTDVEEPNSYLYLKPEQITQEKVYKKYPKINSDLCTMCGKCGTFCRFNALLPAIKKVHVFQDLCHDCGGCSMVCPEGAITYDEKEIGTIYIGTHNGKTMMYGDLNVSELSGVKIIEALKVMSNTEPLLIIDSPPGTACSTVASIEGVDYAIIVAESTPFGLSDMLMVIELLRNMDIPFGVIINKSGLGKDQVREYLEKENIDLIGQIPFQKSYAKASAKGLLLTDEFPEIKEEMLSIIKTVLGDKYETN